MVDVSHAKLFSSFCRLGAIVMISFLQAVLTVFGYHRLIMNQLQNVLSFFQRYDFI